MPLYVEQIRFPFCEHHFLFPLFHSLSEWLFSLLKKVINSLLSKRLYSPLGLLTTREISLESTYGMSFRKIPCHMKLVIVQASEIKFIKPFHSHVMEEAYRFKQG